MVRHLPLCWPPWFVACHVMKTENSREIQDSNTVIYARVVTCDITTRRGVKPFRVFQGVGFFIGS